MKQTIILAIISFTITACGNNQNSGAVTSDTTNVKATVISADTTGTEKAATGTTGTGTVSDSGNAANTGSKNKVDSFNDATRTKSLNGTDTVSR